MNYFAELLENRGFYSDAAKVYQAALSEDGDIDPSEKKNELEKSSTGLERMKAKIKNGVKDLYKL